MAIPTWAPYKPDTALVAAQTSFKALIDAESGPGSIEIFDVDDVTLAVIALTDPCGTVNGTTGQLTLTPDGREESAPAAGTASYALIKDAAGVAHAALPCQAGSSAVSGYCVMSSLAVSLGQPVEVVSAAVG